MMQMNHRERGGYEPHEKYTGEENSERERNPPFIRRKQRMKERRPRKRKRERERIEEWM